MNKRWLKQCKKCETKYWGDAEDTGYCISCAGTVVVACGCGCGETFERKDNVNPKYVKKYYNKACQMRARRRTAVGKAYVEGYNKRYKREEKERECKFPLCGRVFVSAYKRTYCDEHSKPSSQQAVWRSKNTLKAKAHSSINSLYREDRNYKKGRKREACIVCGEEKTEAHHHDYKKPRDVIFLCKPHHVELHSWDSN